MITFLTFVPLALVVVMALSMVFNFILKDSLAIASLIILPIAGIFLYYTNTNVLFYIYSAICTIVFLVISAKFYETFIPFLVAALSATAVYFLKTDTSIYNDLLLGGCFSYILSIIAAIKILSSELGHH
ncbi:MAG: hypothetical protein K6G31_04805 [Paludibacteraceae bacterium]|nr:hypothetical protein [Paludibacteraceae bacterium]